MVRVCMPSCGMGGGVVFRPGVPGLPPGASWETRETAVVSCSTDRWATLAAGESPSRSTAAAGRRCDRPAGRAL